MDTKAAFENFREWWFAPEQMEIRLNVADGWGFKLWQASRAAIEIELPVHCNGISSEAAAYDDALDECIEAITSHGIRIKVKTS